MRQAPTIEQLRRAPKVLLHDHLDGGLRPATVIELAAESGYDRLPTTDEVDLSTWFTAGAARQDLVLYLETFEHTVGVLQTKDALIRVARSARRTSPTTASSTPRCASPPSSTSWRGCPSTRWSSRCWRASASAPPDDRSRSAPSSPPCATPPTPPRSPSWPSATATPASSGSTSPAARPVTLPPVTSTRSSSSRRRTSTSRSTPARRSDCHRSGRRCSSAAPSASATACASSTTSRSTATATATAGRPWAGWPASSAIGACRSRCARRPTSTPACAARSRSTLSASSPGCGSGSR